VPLVLKSLLAASLMTTPPSEVNDGAAPFCARSADTFVPPEAGVVVVVAAAVIAPKARSKTAEIVIARVLVTLPSRQVELSALFTRTNALFMPTELGERER
jgi:hypothetical protein